MNSIPEDLKIALTEGYQFTCNFKGSNVQFHCGEIKLINISELKLTNVKRVSLRSIDGMYEYGELGGYYIIPVFNLIKGGEYYSPLAYFPTFEQYGNYDTEQNTVRLFAKIGWQEIIKNPLKFLNDPFKMFSKSYEPKNLSRYDYCNEDLQINCKGFPEICELHNEKINKVKYKDPLKDLALTCDFITFVNISNNEFPYSGYQLNKHFEICCKYCCELQEKWLTKNTRSMLNVEASTNLAGFVKCPNCEIRFKFDNPNSYRGGKHKLCGQKIKILVNPEYRKS